MSMRSWTNGPSFVFSHTNLRTLPASTAANGTRRFHAI
jgi:hypothetical protein